MAYLSILHLGPWCYDLVLGKCVISYEYVITNILKNGYNSLPHVAQKVSLSVLEPFVLGDVTLTLGIMHQFTASINATFLQMDVVTHDPIRL